MNGMIENGYSSENRVFLNNCGDYNYVHLTLETGTVRLGPGVMNCSASQP